MLLSIPLLFLCFSYRIWIFFYSIIGTQLLEIYALEIQMYTSQKNNKELKKLYEASLQIKSAIAHPLIMGVIRECGGKLIL